MLDVRTFSDTGIGIAAGQQPESHPVFEPVLIKKLGFLPLLMVASRFKSFRVTQGIGQKYLTSILGGT